MKKTLLALALIAGFSCAANATDIGVTADIGTTGVGIHASYPIKPNLNARIGLNYLNYDRSGSTSDADYNFKLKMQTVDVLADYFPMDNGFRVSGGLVYNGNKIDADMKAKNGTQYVINGTTYSAAQAGAINGSIDFKKIAPYLGIGWGNAVKNKGWGFSADLGVMFQGSPKTNLTNTGCQAPVDCAQLARDIAVEKTKLNDEVNKFDAYPVVRVGASYRF
jgi:opacity protein-like surface antigen